MPPPPNKDYFFKLFVVHNDIPLQDQHKLKLTIAPFSHFASLEFIDAKGLLREEWDKLENKHHYSLEVFYKLIAPSLFPQYAKIIISDVDVVFLGDVITSYLEFDSNQSNLIAGVVSNDPEDFFTQSFTHWRRPYKDFTRTEQKAVQYGIGGGYLIVNLKQWRNKGIEQKAIRCFKQNAHRLAQAEQDILSIMCYPHIKKLSPAHIVAHCSWETLGAKWEKLKPNVYSQDEIDEARLRPIQLHYVGDKKPWNTPNQPKSDLWFRYLCKTPFLQEYLSQIESTLVQKYKKGLWTQRILRLIKKKPLFFLTPSFYQALSEKIKNKSQ